MINSSCTIIFHNSRDLKLVKNYVYISTTNDIWCVKSDLFTFLTVWQLKCSNKYITLWRKSILNIISAISILSTLIISVNINNVDGEYHCSMPIQVFVLTSSKVSNYCILDLLTWWGDNIIALYLEKT